MKNGTAPSENVLITGSTSICLCHLVTLQRALFEPLHWTFFVLVLLQSVSIASLILYVALCGLSFPDTTGSIFSVDKMREMPGACEIPDNFCCNRLQHSTKSHGTNTMPPIITDFLRSISCRMYHSLGACAPLVIPMTNVQRKKWKTYRIIEPHSSDRHAVLFYTLVRGRLIAHLAQWTRDGPRPSTLQKNCQNQSTRLAKWFFIILWPL